MQRQVFVISESVLNEPRSFCGRTCLTRYIATAMRSRRAICGDKVLLLHDGSRKTCKLRETSPSRMQSGYLIPPSLLEQWAASLNHQPQETRNAGLWVGLVVVESLVCLIVISMRFRACMLSHSWRPSDKIAIYTSVCSRPPTTRYDADFLSCLHFCTTRCSASVRGHYL